MGRSIKKGSTDQSTVIRIIDATTGLPETAVTFETVGIALWWRREKEAVTAITEATLAAVDSAHSDGGIIHMSDGYYRLDLPDAAVAAGAGENEVFIGGTVTGMVVIGNSHALVDYDPYDTVRMGMTALPNAVADAAGGLPISDAGGLDLDATKADTTEILTRLPDATAGAANGLPIIDATGVKLTKTVDLTAGQAIACSDKTGFSLSATGADLILKSSTFIQAIVAAINEFATYGLTALNTLLVITGIKASTVPALVQADVRTAVGLASANLDTQLAALPTDADVNAACDTAISDAALATAASIAALPTDADINAACDTAISDAGIPAATKTALEVDGSKLDHIWEMTEDDAGTRRLTTNALEQAPSGGLDAAGIRTAVGLASANLDTQLAALPTDADVNAACDTAISDAALATAASIAALPTDADVNTACDTAISDAGIPAATKIALEVDGGKLDHIWEMTEDDAGTRRLTTNALEQAPSGGLDAAGIRTAIGLASANLDTQIAALPTDADVNAACDTAISDAGIPASVWAVSVRTLSSFGTLVADVATAVWSAVTRTMTGVSGSISYPVLSAADRQDYITAIGHMVGGDLPLGEAEKIFAIGAAVKKYSGHHPRIVVEDEDGTGGFDYLLTLLADWTDGFSTIKSVEYPVDDTDETAAILREDAWQIYQKPAGKCLRFLDSTPAATEDLRITYTTIHACTDAACTIPPYDEEAVQILAAAFFCDMLAAYYAQTQDSTIQADSVDHKSKGSEYAARARAYRKMYFDHLGIKEGETPAASVTRDQDKSGSWAGDKMTHPRKYR